MNKLIFNIAPKSPVSEAYRDVRTNLFYADAHGDIKTILFTSSTSGEGKTTTLCNVALSLADSEKRVIIVDCNLRNPMVHKLLDLSNIQGLTDVLYKLDRYDTFIHKTAHPRLDVMTSGKIPANPAEILSSDKIKMFFKLLSEDYDYVLIDTAPVVPVTDTVIMATYIDRVIVVCESGKLGIEMAQLTRERLEKVGANVLGAIINRVKVNKKKYRNNLLYTTRNKE